MNLYRMLTEKLSLVQFKNYYLIKHRNFGSIFLTVELAPSYNNTQFCPYNSFLLLIRKITQ